ncbi:hypothetical protein [Jeotgalibacillus campisalis]|uniref:Uncharacterized protein n=1 Tax=Jeotgalibacillus campisalis TaxID=220754 RepID=A0A0C2W8L8_9BACL|nr:hypothetical protein [Jeotgalibacillus campisalis]KIL52936.1 hypothetical protein KR50_02650 [Jeotgalibacillus campisalis]
MKNRWFILQLFTFLFITGLFGVLHSFAIPLHTFFQAEVLGLPGSFVSSALFVGFILLGGHVIDYFQHRKKATFLKHPLWSKVPFILLAVLLLSAVILTVLFTSISLPSDAGLSYRWVVDLFAAYFTLLFYLLVLSIMIRFGEEVSAEKTLHRAYFSSLAAYILLVFFV